MKQSIAEICRNPLNIRYNPMNQWQGQTGGYNGFAVFSTTTKGFRAAILILLRYIFLGYNTPRKIIARWAPPSENDTEAYVRTVCKRTKLAEDTVIGNAQVLQDLVLAMAFVESGKPYLPDKYILAWSALRKEDLGYLYDTFMRLNGGH